MNLRQILAATALFSIASMAQALEVLPYTPAAFQAAQQAKQTTALHFHADWCSVCRNQSMALEQLKSDPALKDVTVFKVNYDTEKALRKELKIRSQSVFVVYQGSEERTRLAGETDREKIKAGLRPGGL
ncbi:thioredoxin family protein [Iodobacter ciconiae]|uniref:Thioredoxin n=1 Tax=Iodobacter ciconiae TaxID=2496266 RepID=A0A3S8ZNX7_9NEIS|nr:thioredoxin family protein [Iodobacter ciconiae]AZN35257.1 thioredoxin [Iodobacter ciconiae]